MAIQQSPVDITPHQPADGNENDDVPLAKSSTETENFCDETTQSTMNAQEPSSDAKSDSCHKQFEEHITPRYVDRRPLVERISAKMQNRFVFDKSVTHLFCWCCSRTKARRSQSTRNADPSFAAQQSQLTLATLSLTDNTPTTRLEPSNEAQQSPKNKGTQSSSGTQEPLSDAKHATCESERAIGTLSRYVGIGRAIFAFDSFALDLSSIR